MLDRSPTPSFSERRKYPRFFVISRLTLAVEDESQGESIGLGEPGDISVGGLRVRNLPACPNVRVGDRLGLLLINAEDAYRFAEKWSITAPKTRSESSLRSCPLQNSRTLMT